MVLPGAAEQAQTESGAKEGQADFKISLRGADSGDDEKMSQQGEGEKTDRLAPRAFPICQVHHRRQSKHALLIACPVGEVKEDST